MSRINLYYIILFAVMLISGYKLPAQQLSLNRNKTLQITDDTTRIDSLSIVPGSLEFADSLHKNSFILDAPNALMIVKNPEKFFLQQDSISIKISYRVFAQQFNRQWKAIYSDTIDRKAQTVDELFIRSQNEKEEDFFDFGELQKSGAISRGFSIGNQQDASLSSDLNLQLNGALTNEMNIRAAITDNNIPIQPEGNTQQIQEFDKVFIEISQNKTIFTAGDFEVREQKNHFLKYKLKGQGVKAQTVFETPDSKSLVSASASAALSKGKYARNQIQGQEANQGPYKLEGNNNERFIIVFAGSETIYLDGEKLTRGENQDYTINYNAGEITFTPKHIINKDSRIIVEFEYSDRNYARSLITANTGYRTKNLDVQIQYFNQSDLKNQPFELEMNDTTRSILSRAGDDMKQAVRSGIDSTGFNQDEILYKMTDSLGYDSVLVYSTNPDSAVYRVKFSKVGQGNGDYTKTQSSANGTVYQWIEPVGGRSQGNYAPVQVLIPPKKHELFSIKGQYDFSKSLSSGLNFTASNQDLNLFSDKDAKDNKGYATELWIKHQQSPGQTKDSSRFKWVSHGSFQVIHRNFNAVQRFRSVEFNRDWNLEQVRNHQEIHSEVTTNFQDKKYGQIELGHQYLERRGSYQGNRYQLKGNYRRNGYLIKVQGSFLHTDQGSLQSRYIRHKIVAGKAFNGFMMTIDEEKDQNMFYLDRDSLNSNSFAFQRYGAEVSLPDTGRFSSSLRLEQRKDHLPLSGQLREASLARQASFQMNWKISKQQNLNAQISWRKLSILDSLSNNKPEENLTSRVQYSGRFANGAITNQTFYESGSGLEVEKTFTYLEVSPGQGVYQWEDYNGNGVKELNEFEIATFQDQANYIRIYTPSDDYIRVYTNQFRQILHLNPGLIWTDHDQLMRKILKKFTNRLTYRVSQKNQFQEYIKAYNPFHINQDNDSLITLNQQFKNVLYFQRSHSRFGAHWSYEQNQNKSLLANGSEQQSAERHKLYLRWNLNSAFSFFSEFKLGSKTRESEFFANKEYEITYHEIEPQLHYQPGRQFRIKGMVSWSDKENTISAKEQASIMDYGVETKLSRPEHGDLQLELHYLAIKYPNPQNSTLEYEMLQGFKAGDNFRWTISYQRKILDYLQMNVQYEGRKTPGAKTIHIGRIQLRAMF
ncbi:MAG: hypothetical protein R6T91_03885 [Bacteroidales bacterium]